jgi:hypothetical protein
VQLPEARLALWAQLALEVTQPPVEGALALELELPARAR